MSQKEPVSMPPRHHLARPSLPIVRIFSLEAGRRAYVVIGTTTSLGQYDRSA